MRSCIYCGKSLNPDEKCSCAQSVRARAEKERQNTSEAGTSWHNPDNMYTTGYTKKEKKRRFFKKRNINTDAVKTRLLEFIKDPVNSVLNPRPQSKLWILLTVLFQGIILSGAWYFISYRIFGRVMNILSQGIAAPIMRQYTIVEFLLTAVFGGIGIAAAILVFFAVFWCMDRFVMKRKTLYLEFSQRLVYATLPVSILGVLGILVGFFSVSALILFVAAGLLMSLVLTFEALKAEWSMISASRVFYLMSAGVLIALTVILNILT